MCFVVCNFIMCAMYACVTYMYMGLYFHSHNIKILAIVITQYLNRLFDFIKAQYNMFKQINWLINTLENKLI